MSIGPSSMSKELLNYFGFDNRTVSLPGFIRSRSKIREEAFIELMKMMNKAFPVIRPKTVPRIEDKRAVQASLGHRGIIQAS